MTPAPPPPLPAGLRVAIVGAGVSGLAAAHYLSRRHAVTVFEADGRLGGHAHTHEVRDGGTVRRLDTGFLVYNRVTYPGFVRLLDELGVASVPTDMSLSVRCRACDLEYGVRGARAIFAQKRNLLRPAFFGLFADLRRFFRDGRAFLAAGGEDGLTLGAFLDRGGYGRELTRHWLLPTAAALWSASFESVLAYEARFFLAFFENHGFLRVRQLPWWTVEHGSRTYVDALARGLAGRVRLSSPVREVRRAGPEVRVTVEGRPPEPFDAVVLACHADGARALLADASPEEDDLLGRFSYARHRVLLHTDRSFLPRAPAAWSAWNCDLEDCRDAAAPASLTYYLNRLQSVASETPFCVTLNPRREPTGILAEMQYAHPQLTAGAARAARSLTALSGRRSTWYAGAHLGHGFHEDGVASALAVAAGLGVTP